MYIADLHIHSRYSRATSRDVYKRQARHCDAAISLDADLQDDVDACDQMIERFKAGCDIVYGVRKKRTTDSAFKRLTAEGFYKLMNLLGANTVYNHADFRLMSRRALKLSLIHI